MLEIPLVITDKSVARLQGFYIKMPVIVDIGLVLREKKGYLAKYELQDLHFRNKLLEVFSGISARLITLTQ